MKLHPYIFFYNRFLKELAQLVMEHMLQIWVDDLII
jgi:hypothetical protein